MGPGSKVGPALAASPDIDAVSFTGSQDVGPSVAAAAVKTGARVQLEMGGKNPLIVLDDADLATAVSVAINGAFFQAGQRCTASSRLIVTEGIHDRFVEAMIARMKTLVVDDALKAGTEIGPSSINVNWTRTSSMSKWGRRKARDWRKAADDSSARPTGYYMAPALFTDSAPAMRINQEEIFGPVASVIRVRDYEEALAMANATPFGLSAGIVTTSLKDPSHFKRNSESGLVMVNLPTAGLDYHVPFGGRKKSSYGPREQGTYAKDFYTIVKTAYVAPSSRGETPAAFDGRCILAGCVAPSSHTPGMPVRRALPARRLTRLGATLAFHHGLLTGRGHGPSANFADLSQFWR